MPSNNDREDNVEFINTENYGKDVKYFGGNEPDSEEQMEHGYAQGMEEGLTGEEVMERHPTQEFVPEGSSDSEELTRDQMRDALEAEGVDTGLAKNASKAKYRKIYEEHFGSSD